MTDPFTPEQLVKALNILIINFPSNSSEVPVRRYSALQKGAGLAERIARTAHSPDQDQSRKGAERRKPAEK